MTWSFRVATLFCLLLWGGVGYGESTPSPKPSVVIYLHNGTDITGELVKLDATHYTLKTATGTNPIGRKKYQAMVLDTPEEKAVAESIARDPSLYMDAAKYSFTLRGEITKALKLPKQSSCSFKSQPLAHFQVMPNGTLQKIVLLLSSGCPAVDESILKTLRTTRGMPFPKYFNLKLFPMNYSYAPTTKPK